MKTGELDIQKNILIREYTTFGIGGRVKHFVGVNNADELVGAIKFALKNKIKFHILAGGSNIVFDDGLLDVLIIRLNKPNIFGKNGRILNNAFEYITKNKNRVVCDGSVSLADLINFSINNGLSGLETLSGIPGTVSGAIVGNAAAYGQTISDPLIRVQIFNGKKIYWLSKKDCKFSYRESLIQKKPWYVLRAEFIFSPSVKKDLVKKSKEIISIRSKKYPSEMKCPGSFFKNILLEDIPKKSLHLIPQNRDWYGKVPAWFFLNEVGARGMREGGIYIPDYHGNLLVNDGTGTFADVKKLADKLKKMVKEKFGIVLNEEVRYIK